MIVSSSDSRVSLAPVKCPWAGDGRLVGPSHFLDFHSVSVSELSQSVRRDLWPLRHLIRVMRRNEPGCMEALMLLENLHEGLKA